MTPELEHQIRRLTDRAAIEDCLHRYCRGVDRADEAALRSAYWPDATDRHGPYQGTAAGFIDWARDIWATGPRNIHVLSNILIDFRSPDEAAVESCFTAHQRGTGADGVVRQVMLIGRYCDLFEKRAAEWRIAARTVVYDWVEDQTPPAAPDAERFGPRQPVGSTWPDDPVYHIGRPAGAARVTHDPGRDQD
ncbi:nuclear transport factor 2 family protein [Pararhodobacter sp.]|uniref:nuclear transport factor 2 family protein n=1 Tax=Pararhodobacter sp. TaxID=2127056 RepID=UPI002FDEA3DC